MARRHKDRGFKKREAKNSASPEERLEEVRTLADGGYFNRAEKQCQQLIADHPDYVGALFEMAKLCRQNSNSQKAAEMLIRARLYAPNDLRVLNMLVEVCAELEAYDMALGLLRQALEADPGSAHLLVLRADILNALGQLEDAIPCYRRAQMLDPAHQSCAYRLARCLIDLGRTGEAKEVLKNTLQTSNNITMLIECLSQLARPEVAFSADDLAREYERVKRIMDDVPPPDEMTLDWVHLAQAVNAGDHAAAWRQAQAANRAKQIEKPREEIEDLQQQVTLLQEHTPLLEPKSLTGTDAVRTLHILGPSRSGKTSIERLLHDHPGVVPGYENHFLRRAIAETLHSADLYAASYRIFPQSQLSTLLACLQKSIEPLAKDASVMTCTMPTDIVHVHTLARADERARFVFVKRDPYDTALRMYFTQYGSKNFYSYSIKNALDYIEAYNSLIDELVRLLPGRTLLVRYEELVADPKGHAERLADFAGLDLSTATLPNIGDDRDCSKPYRAMMDAELAAT